MSVVGDATAQLMRAMGKNAKGDRPEGATTIYKVCWCVRSDSFDGMGGRISSSPTPRRLDRSKSFVSKVKAETLKDQLTDAFKVLEYGMEGLVYIEEDWYEQIRRSRRSRTYYGRNPFR